MSSALDEFQRGSANWRQTIKKNQRRTFWVITSFVLIYLCIGMLFDLYLVLGKYPQVPMATLFKALITLQLFPIATLIAGGVAIISLLVTFAFHNKLMLMGTNSFEITPETARNLDEKRLYNTVEEMKVAAGLRYMPKVFIIEADYMNAFASGYSEKSAMVAITSGLLAKLDRDELTAVMAHELSHIRHMDIKLTLMASVLSNLTLMLIDILFFASLFGGSSERGGKGRNNLFIIIMILRYLLPLITMLLMLYLSRTREYMADAGSVELMRTNEPMARALLKIQSDHTDNKEAYANSYKKTPHESVRRAAYIFDPTTAGISTKESLTNVFSTHPSIKKRLQALGFNSKKNKDSKTVD
jgi:heat shock protein HtpX